MPELDRCPACRQFVAQHGGPELADSMCPSCPGWGRIFDRLVPADVLVAVEAERLEWRHLVEQGVSARHAAGLVEGVGS